MPLLAVLLLSCPVPRAALCADATLPRAGAAVTGQLPDRGGQAVQIVDDLGRTIRLEQPARRVVALYGAFNEMLAAMGREDLPVARTSGDTLPPSILDRPSIGTHMRPSVELVVGLSPDLVLQMGGRQAATEPVRALERHGIPTAYFSVASFGELFSVIMRVGELTGSRPEAARLVRDMREKLAAVEAVVQSRARPTVLFEVRARNLLAAGGGSIVNDVIRRAGGVNAVNMPRRVARLGEEEVLRLNPDFYLVQSGPMNRDPLPLDERPRLSGLRCVRQGRFARVDEALFSRPGPRSALAVQRLARLLHPDLDWTQADRKQ